jgi:glycerophosphoryl diester phosphodiesterase
MTIHFRQFISSGTRHIIRKADLVGAAIWLTAPHALRTSARLYRKAKYYECIATLSDLLSTRPGYAPAHFRKGMAELKLQQWDDAHTSISTAITQWPWRTRWRKYKTFAKQQQTSAEQASVAAAQQDAYSKALTETRFLLHIGDGPEASYMIDLWYPYIVNVDQHVVIVVRSKQLFKDLKAKRPDLPVVYIGSSTDAEWLVANAPNLAGILYAANTGNALSFLRYNHLRHIFVGHGDSEKVASCHKYFRAYDEIWTAGRAHVSRFRNASFDHASLRFRIVGRPSLRPLIKSDQHGPPDRFLYLPTWEGHHRDQEYTSVWFAKDIIRTALRETSLAAVVKLHPWTGRRLPELHPIAAAIPTEHNPTVVTVHESGHLAAALMQDSRFLIADISSVVSDYLLTTRPIFLYTPSNSSIRVSQSSYSLQSYCYCFQHHDELAQLIRRVIVRGDDALQATRLKAAEYFVDKKRTVDQAFESALLEVANEQHKPLPQRKGFAQFSSVHRQTDTISPLPTPLIIGHRGAMGEHTENSISGFRALAHMRALHAVELDVHLTADGELVVIHDATVDRTTNGHGFVRTKRLSELQQLRLRNLPADEHSLLDETIPTLSEVFTSLAGSHLRLYVELKCNDEGSTSLTTAENILEMACQFDLRDRITMTSFSPAVLEDIRFMDADIPLLASLDTRSVTIFGGLNRCLATIDRIPHCSLALQRQLFCSSIVSQLRERYLRDLGVWVVNDTTRALKVASLGARFITTDHPTVLSGFFPNS